MKKRGTTIREKVVYLGDDTGEKKRKKHEEKKIRGQLGKDINKLRKMSRLSRHSVHFYQNKNKNDSHLERKLTKNPHQTKIKGDRLKKCMLIYRRRKGVGMYPSVLIQNDLP